MSISPSSSSKPASPAVGPSAVGSAGAAAGLNARPVGVIAVSSVSIAAGTCGADGTVAEKPGAAAPDAFKIGLPILVKPNIITIVAAVLSWWAERTQHLSAPSPEAAATTTPGAALAVPPPCRVDTAAASNATRTAGSAATVSSAKRKCFSKGRAAKQPFGHVDTCWVRLLTLVNMVEGTKTGASDVFCMASKRCLGCRRWSAVAEPQRSGTAPQRVLLLAPAAPPPLHPSPAADLLQQQLTLRSWFNDTDHNLCLRLALMQAEQGLQALDQPGCWDEAVNLSMTVSRNKAWGVAE